MEVEFSFGFRGEKHEIARLLSFLKEMEGSNQYPVVTRAWRYDDELGRNFESLKDSDITQLYFTGYGEPCGKVMTDIFCKAFPELEVGYRDNKGFDEDDGYNYIYSWAGSDTYASAEWVFFGKYAAVDEYGDWIEDQEADDLEYWSKPLKLAESLFCTLSKKDLNSNYGRSRREGGKTGQVKEEEVKLE
ncbi:MAG: hypothetical protein LBT59_21660 [Clostridiales bacterium]|nr:hypothetical protein [Clostridiales bacterium]